MKIAPHHGAERHLDPIAAPARMQTPLLLMDGSVFGHQYQSLNWWRLTPDASGDYVHGTWTLAAALLADGRHYQIVVSVGDKGGNRTSVSAAVTVPHDRR